MEEFIVRKEVRIRAGRWQVWQALTDPELTRQYFFGCRVESSWQEGSAIAFKGRIFGIWPIKMKGTVKRIEPGHILRYTLENKGGSTSTVTDTINEDGSQTVLTIMDDVGQGPGARKRYLRSLKGWDKVLPGLKAMLEERK